jgi:hypothetical protein
MLVIRRLEIKALILALLAVSRAGVPMMRSHGKSRSQHDEAQGREVLIGCAILNKMLETRSAGIMRGLSNRLSKIALCCVFDSCTDAPLDRRSE